MVSSFGNTRGQCISLHIILPRVAHSRERGAAVGTLQGGTEVQRYWCPVMQLLFALFKCGRTAPHRGDGDAGRDDAYEFRGALNFYELAYRELAHVSSTLYTHPCI